MNYLYHDVPGNMRGQTLFPLNVLKKKYPSVYREEIKKYAGRPEVLSIVIPTLDCLWNDVLHFTAVHPKKIKEAHERVGIVCLPRRFYKINPRVIDSSNATIFVDDDKPLGERFFRSNFTSYSVSKLSRYSHIPKKTLAYYKERAKLGKMPFTFYRIPHILYKGSLSIKNVEVIEI